MAGERRRLCIVVPTHWEAKMGGSQYQAQLFVDYLLARGGYELFYLARNVPHRDNGGDVGVRIVQVGKGEGIRARGLFFDAPQLYRTLAAIRPHAIYQHVGCAYTGVAAHYARRTGCRMLWRVSSDRNLLPLSFPTSTAAGLEWIERRFLDYGIAHASCIAAQTDYQRRLLAERYRREDAAVVRNFHPGPDETLDKSGPATVLWIGNFKRVKRPEAFVELARVLAGTPARFVMVGKEAADRRWQAELESAMAGVENLSYLGARSQEAVNQLLAQAHLLVNTSAYEGFSNTFVQAWLRRVPVASLTVNPDGVFDRGEVGLLGGDMENLVAIVRLFIEQPELREQCGRAAEGHAREYHSERNMAQLVELLEGAGGGVP